MGGECGAHLVVGVGVKDWNSFTQKPPSSQVKLLYLTDDG